MFRHGRVALIATGCAAILGAMLLIPSGEQVAVAEATPVAAVGETSQETIAAIDAMLGTGGPELPPQEVVAKRSITEADRNLMTAALTSPETGTASETDMEGAPLVDSNLRPDSIGRSAVNMRAGPSTATATIGVLQPGAAVQTGESDGGWVEVTLTDGTTGWVYSRYLASTAATVAAADAEEAPAAKPSKPNKAAKPSKTAKAVVKGNDNDRDLEGRTARIDAALVARSKPSGNASGVFRTSPGERVRILDVRGNWLRIITADGSTGWIERAG